MKHNFVYISKRDPQVRQAHEQLIKLINEVQDLVRNKFTFQYHFVGSYESNMITYDEKSNVGFDFDVNIEVNDDENHYEAKTIKNTIRKAIDKVAKEHGYDYAEDSTRVLTIKVKDRKNSKILHSCDFAIVNNYVDDQGYDCQEYIRYNKSQNSYDWVEQSHGFYDIDDKIDWLKEHKYWNEVRNRYLELKNKNEDINKHSRSLRAEAINQLYYRYKYND